MRCVRFLLPAVATLILVVAVPGCGGGTKPHGKLTINGKPPPVSDNCLVQMAFVNADPSQGTTSYTANVDRKDHSTYEVEGTDNKGIPAGKYKVTVQLIDPYPGGKDLLGGKYATPQATNIVKEVSGSGAIDIDISS